MVLHNLHFNLQRSFEGVLGFWWIKPSWNILSFTSTTVCLWFAYVTSPLETNGVLSESICNMHRFWMSLWYRAIAANVQINVVVATFHFRDHTEGVKCEEKVTPMMSCLNSDLPNLNFCLSAYLVQGWLSSWPALGTYNAHLAMYSGGKSKSFVPFLSSLTDATPGFLTRNLDAGGYWCGQSNWSWSHHPSPESRDVTLSCQAIRTSQKKSDSFAGSFRLPVYLPVSSRSFQVGSWFLKHFVCSVGMYWGKSF